MLDQNLITPRKLRCLLALIVNASMSLPLTHAGAEGNALVKTRASDTARWQGFLRGDSLADVNPATIPLTWTPDAIAWKTKLQGYGQSSPIAWDGKIFVTTVEGKNKENYRVSAINLVDGKTLWTHSITSTSPVESTYLVSRSAPTPVCDDRRVIAFFESGDVVSLTHDGKEEWKRSLASDYGKFDNKFGLAASPVQNDKAVFILIDHGGPSYLVALSKQDGKTLWKTPRESRRSWSSPYFANIAGQPQIVCSSFGSVDGYHPETGNRLWTFADVGANSAATPVVFEGQRVLLGSLIRPSEGTSEKAERSNLLAHISRVDDRWTFNVDWIAKKARGSFCSPLAANSCAYWVNSSGVVFCLDLKTGNELYSKRLACGPCWASPLVVGERVYFFGKDGETTVLKSGPQYEELATGNRLWEKVDLPPRRPDVEKPQAKDPATNQAAQPLEIQKEPNPARRQAMANGAGPIQYAAIIVSDAILIRSGDHLFCIRDSAKKP